MPIHTRPSIRGFIASEPRLSQTEDGDPRVRVRFGQERSRKEEDGSFTKLDTTFDTLVAYDENALRIAENFVKGDRFVAQGYTRSYTNNNTGMEGEVFVATGIGPDSAYTRYEVDRSARGTGIEQTAPEHAASREATAVDAPERRQPTNTASALGM